ncbi:MAG: hypothetical protein HYU69_10495 [Bacteroidetes bacterium]|nr:hypothetical protein [Bacteroidota bacterium]
MYKTLFSLSIVIIIVASCTKDRGEIELTGITTDAKLFAYMKAQTFSYYKDDNVNQIVSTSSGAHSNTYFLKFNAKAKSALGSDGKLPTGASFPDSSLVVKELYNGGAAPWVYAIMMKNSKSPFAKNGWLWAEIFPDGTPAHSITKDASSCVGCHTGGRDYLQSFDAHP